nr:leucine-rich repeat protein [Tanacetum cinerariifolium]
EPASPMRDDSQGEACPTNSGFEADQDMANIAKTSTLPHESILRVTSLVADEGSLQLHFQELMDFCTSLQRQQSELVSKFTAQALEITELKARVKFLEDRQGEGINLSGDDAPIKGRRLDEEEVATQTVSSDNEEIRLDEKEVAAERVSNDTEEMATVLITMDAASVLSSGEVQGKKKDGGDSYTKKKKRLQEQIGIQFARELEEELEREAQRMNDQIARDKEIANIHAEEELQQMIEGLDRSNETIAKHLEEYEQAAAELIIGERIELISELVKYQDHHSKILQYQAQQRKTRTKKQKRDFYMAVIRNNLGSAKKQKKSEEVPEEVKSFDEVPEEKIKELIRLIDREDLNQLWALVKETLSVRPATDKKEMELWVELKRIYEPDVEDHLWTYTQHIMHALVEWRLYDTCGVHHVMFKDLQIFMLVEKNYPLRKALALVMICYKLQVEYYSQMATDLVRKIQQIAGTPSLQGRIVGNKMHKAFPLPVTEFPLPEELPTAREDSCHCQKKREATARNIALLSMSRRNCQSKVAVTLKVILKLTMECVSILRERIEYDLFSRAIGVGNCARIVAQHLDRLIKAMEQNDARNGKICKI